MHLVPGVLEWEGLSMSSSVDPSPPVSGRPAWLRTASDVAFIACLAMIAIEQQFAFSIPTSVELNSVRIDGQDIAAVAMVALAILGRFWRRIAGTRKVLLAVILILALVGAARSVEALGLQTGVNHERPWLYAFAALIFGIAFARNRWRTWRLILVIIGLLIALTQAVALFALGWDHGFNDSTLANGAFYGTRPLGADAALIMLMALLASLFTTRWKPWLRSVIAVILGLSCIWSQARSVWLAIVVALAIYVIVCARNRDSRIGVFVSAALLGTLMLVSVIPIVTGFSILPVNTNALRAVNENSVHQDGGYAIPKAPVYGDVRIRKVKSDVSGSPLLSTGTLDFRITLWKSRLVADRSITGWILGETLEPNSLSGADSGVIRADLTSHSEPVEDFVRGGIVGLGCILALFVMALTGRRDTPTDAWIFVCALAPFGLVYMWPTWTWVIIGLCLSRQFLPSDVVTSRKLPE